MKVRETMKFLTAKEKHDREVMVWEARKRIHVGMEPAAEAPKRIHMKMEPAAEARLSPLHRHQVYKKSNIMFQLARRFHRGRYISWLAWHVFTYSVLFATLNILLAMFII